MMNISPFGNIDINNLEECYEAEINIQNSLMHKDVEIDVNFEEETTDEETLQKVADFINQLPTLAEKALVAVNNDYDLDEESGTARFYLQHHLDNSTQEEINDIFGNGFTNLEPEMAKKTFLSKLALYRVGIYPEDDESFAIFDIQLPKDYTNYLMAVTFNDENELVEISLES